jgi:hypothetical protein
LSQVLEQPIGAAAALRATGATHVIVHEAAYAGSRGPAISSWLLSKGARLVAADGTDKLYALASGS